MAWTNELDQGGTEEGRSMVDYSNYIRQLQQLMDSIGPVQEELRRLQGLHEQLQLGGAVEQAISAVRERDELLQRAVSPTLARDLLDQVTISQSVFESAASLMPNPDLLLQAAIRPLFDLPSLGFNFNEVAASLGFLNASVQAAPFLTDLAVQPEEEEASDEEQVIEAAEERLIGIASPEAMEALRSVQQLARFTLSLSVSNSSSGRRWKLDHAPAVGDPTHMVAFGTGRRAFAREA